MFRRVLKASLTSYVLAVCACTFPKYYLDENFNPNDPPDVGGPQDAKPEADVRIEVNAPCQGFDEDGDGYPDQCDNCPNVFNTDQSAQGKVGAACASDLVANAERLKFDSFRDTSLFTARGSSAGGLSVAPDGSSFFFGSKNDQDLRFAHTNLSIGDKATVVTSELTITDDASGTGGVLVRVSGTGTTKDLYYCGVSPAKGIVAAIVQGADGASQTAESFLNAKDGSQTKIDWPAALAHNVGDRIGVRATVLNTSANTADFECRVFDPRAASTLKSAAPVGFSVKAQIQSIRFLGSGEVGFFARSAKVQFFSLDIMRAP